MPNRSKTHFYDRRVQIKYPGCVYCGCPWHDVTHVVFREGIWCRHCLYECWRYGLISDQEALELGIIDVDEIAKSKEYREKEREEKDVK